jgi:hypothetical protein
MRGDATPGVLQKSAEEFDGKGFRQTLFFKSAEECENRGVNFVRLVARSEKSEGAKTGRAGREWG